MSELPDIFNTKIVDSVSDAFWKDLPAYMKEWEAKQVLVISTPFQDNSEEDLQLKKMLQACQLPEDQIHVLQLDEAELLSWSLLREHLKPKQIILLGIAPDQLGIHIHFMPHQVNRFNECSWVPTVSLKELKEFEDIKKHVWNYGLKPVFIEKIYG